ncbi:MAG: prepilin-type N-terminal cleavage/methylation domain-containing protein, partial [Planctomycetota bacterium]
MGFEASSVVGRRSSASQGLTPRPLRRGLTLVELLVVIVLVSTLVSTAIPIISPGGEGRKLREASRNINAYFQGAQARAIETGRPFGVAMRRLSEETGRGDDNAVVTRLEYVEVPAPYSGFDTSSLARLCVGTATTGQPGVRQLALQLIRYGSAVDPNEDRLPAGYDVDLVPDRFLRPGDQVEVGGTRYVLILPTIETITLFSQGPLQLAGTHGVNSVAAGFFDTSAQTGFFDVAPESTQYIFALRPAEESEERGVFNANGIGATSLTPGGDLRATH